MKIHSHKETSSSPVPLSDTVGKVDLGSAATIGTERSTSSIDAALSCLSKHNIDIFALGDESFSALQKSMQEIDSSQDAASTHYIDRSLFIKSIRDLKRSLRDAPNPEVNKALCDFITDEFSTLSREFDASDAAQLRLHTLRVAFALLNTGNLATCDKESNAFANQRKEPDLDNLNANVALVIEKALNTNVKQLRASWNPQHSLHAAETPMRILDGDILAESSDGQSIHAIVKIVHNCSTYAQLESHKPPTALHALFIETGRGTTGDDSVSWSTAIDTQKEDEIKTLLTPVMRFHFTEAHASTSSVLWSALLTETAQRSNMTAATRSFTKDKIVWSKDPQGIPIPQWEISDRKNTSSDSNR